MSQFARVTSIGVLQTLAAALQRFRGESNGALDDLEIELRRALEWIHNDRKEHWSHELRRREEAVSSARLKLQQAKTSRRIEGHQPMCIDEQRALDRAKQRLETAMEKVRAVQHWGRAIDRAVDEFQQHRAAFATWLDLDLPKAVAALDRMSQSLESYVSLATPSEAEGETPDENDAQTQVVEKAVDKGASP